MVESNRVRFETLEVSGYDLTFCTFGIRLQCLLASVRSTIMGGAEVVNVDRILLDLMSVLFIEVTWVY